MLAAFCLSPLRVISRQTSETAATKGFSLKGTVYERVGKEANIDPLLLYAITCVESAITASSKEHIRPYPWTLRYAGRPFYGKNRGEAEQRLKAILLRNPNASVDIGIAQINNAWHGHRVKNRLDLLDPYTNLKVAAQILNDCLKRHPNDAFKAIGTYHSSTPHKSARYARYVVNVYTRLKENALRNGV